MNRFHHATAQIPEFRVYDLVLVRNHQKQTKLDQNWLGPFRILKRTGQHSYILAKDEPNARTFQCHVRNMKRFYVRH